MYSLRLPKVDIYTFEAIAYWASVSTFLVTLGAVLALNYMGVL